MSPAHFAESAFDDYELVDSGGGEKLERYGPIVVRRPDPQALWRPRADAREWEAAHLRFERDEQSGGKRGRWIEARNAPSFARGEGAGWEVRWRGATSVVRPTPFKHLGLFPEQAANWEWIANAARALGLEPGLESGLESGRPRLLNLFGYTGVASIVAAQAGYEVTHVDASKTSLAWMKENARASKLADDALRVILDDALAFARREVRRGARYHGIVLDPPHYGRGPKGEVWQFEEHIAPLVEACAALLESRSWLVLSTYAIGFSPLSLANLLAPHGDGLEAGELVLGERAAGRGEPRKLPCGFCARLWRGIELRAELGQA
jgi:23S rRNA (cytosine1962-C5)-methyltransferase